MNHTQSFSTSSVQRLTLRALLSLALLAISIGGITSVAHAQEKGGSGVSSTTPGDPNSLCAINFLDVLTTDYFYAPVRSLTCMGAINGYDDGTFRPYAPASRGQLAKVMVVLKGWPLVNPPSPSFSDVPPGSAYYVYVETARVHNVIGGFPDGTFRPDDNVSRGQLSKIVVNAEGWPLANPPSPSFTDVPPGSTYYQYVETAVQRGMVTGFGDDTFRTGGTATRGQTSKIAFNANGVTLTAEEQATVDLINGRRMAMGLVPLQVNASLTSAARRQSNDIGPLGLCQHNGTDGSSPWDRIADAGYTGSALGEVVGCSFSTPQGVVDAWWNSPGHYAVLTSPDANQIGCGWWIGTNGYGWQTCDTGRAP